MEIERRVPSHRSVYLMIPAMHSSSSLALPTFSFRNFQTIYHERSYWTWLTRPTSTSSRMLLASVYRWRTGRNLISKITSRRFQTPVSKTTLLSTRHLGFAKRLSTFSAALLLRSWSMGTVNTTIMMVRRLESLCAQTYQFRFLVCDESIKYLST
jgi:hypothetical protein